MEYEAYHEAAQAAVEIDETTKHDLPAELAVRALYAQALS